MTTPPFPFSQFLISLMVSVDVKHHVYLLAHTHPRTAPEEQLDPGSHCGVLSEDSEIEVPFRKQ